MTSSSSLCWTLLSSLHSSLGVIAPSLTNIYNRGGFVTFELSCRRCLCFLKPQESSRIVPTLYSTDFLVQDAVKSPVNQIIYITCLICEPQMRSFLHIIKKEKVDMDFGNDFFFFISRNCTTRLPYSSTNSVFS